MHLSDLSKQDLETLAKKVGRKYFTLYRVGRGLVRPGLLLCLDLERESGGLIHKEDLRPDVWPRKSSG